MARPRQGSVREGAGWVSQGTDNDGEENIAIFFSGAMNKYLFDPFWLSH